MKCIVCHKPATCRFSPDLDIQGIAACDEHKEMVREDILFCSLELKTWSKMMYKYKKIREENEKGRQERSS